ncbi:MAG: GNAT family N-acetyltransferase [Robiginitomaculum sp.]|nr:MAG: GNAT family N-acetyltransferase [Robiginitomaculum sp.]
MALLLDADPDEAAVRAYLKTADILVANHNTAIIGIAVLTHQDGGFELRNIAVHNAHQGKGIAKQLISEIKTLAKNKGATTLEVGTGNSSLGQLALYQKCGFRLHSIDKNFFANYEPIFENGIRCIDMVRLRAKL